MEDASFVKAKAYVVTNLAAHYKAEMESNPEFDEWFHSRRAQQAEEQMAMRYIVENMIVNKTGEDVLERFASVTGFSDEGKDVFRRLTKDSVGSWSQADDFLTQLPPADRDIMLNVAFHAVAWHLPPQRVLDDYDKYGAWDTDDIRLAVLADQTIHEWASTSMDSNPKSIAMQIAASNIFGVEETLSIRPATRTTTRGLEFDVDEDGSLINPTPIPGNDGEMEYEKNKVYYDTTVKAIYQETQDFFKANNIESITAYRGMSITVKDDTTLEDWRPLDTPEASWMPSRQEWDDYVLWRKEMHYESLVNSLREEAPYLDMSKLGEWREKYESLWKQQLGWSLGRTLYEDLIRSRSENGEATMDLQPLSSFSLTPHISQRFSSPDGKYDMGIIVYAEVPASRVFSTSLTGPGCTNEYEAIIVGGMNLPATVRADDLGVRRTYPAEIKIKPHDLHVPSLTELFGPTDTWPEEPMVADEEPNPFTEMTG